MYALRYILSIAILLTQSTAIVYDSCETAKKQGSNSSGMHTIWKQGRPPLSYWNGLPHSEADVDQVYCDIDTFGGGWTLIAYSDPSGNWPPIDYNFNPRRTSAAMDNMDYSPEWERDHSFYRLFDTDGIQEDWIMFRAGDNSAYCAFVRQDILEISLLGLLKTTTILGSENVGLRHGELTNHMYTGESEKAHPLVGCEGSYEQNQNRLLWAENGAGLGISFKNQHLGMGVFVRSRDDVAPIPILIRVNDLYHSQIQVVFSEPIEDSNKWVEPNPNDFRVRMGDLEWINVTRYIKINATFMINGTITVIEKDNINSGNERKVNRSNLTFTHQEWYDINMNGQIWDGIYVKDVVLSNVTTLEQQRPNVADIVSASLTSDGNLTLSLSKNVKYGVGINVQYWPSHAIDSKYTRRISDIFHNQVVAFGPIEGDNQINPLLNNAVVNDVSPNILNMTFTAVLIAERVPQVKNFNVSVDNQSIPILSVAVDYNGRIILELEPRYTTIARPWSASSNTIYDPMQPIDVSYYKSEVPVNFTNVTYFGIDAYKTQREIITSIEATHISDGYNRAVSTFVQLTVHNHVRDTTSPIYRTSYVYDLEPNIIVLEFTELSLKKICDHTCGKPHAEDFNVVVDGFVIPKHQMHASIPMHQGKVHLKLLNCTITYQQNVYVSYVPSVQYSDRKFKDMWGNDAKLFSNKKVINLVNPAPRVALVSDLKHSSLQIYFTGTGANAGHLHIDDWRVWYEHDQRGQLSSGLCTDLKHPINNTVWIDDKLESCLTFERDVYTNKGKKESYCSQYGHLIPKNGAQTANVACCTCGGGTFDVQLLDARVVHHPTMGRVDLLLPNAVLNGESLKVQYTRHPTNTTRW